MASRSYSHSYSSYSSSYSSSSTTSGGRTTGSTYTSSMSSNPSGTTIHTTSQQAGQPAVSETTRYPPAGPNGGRARQGIEGMGMGNERRIEDVTDKEEEERGRAYEERMEEEYAKREGGA